MIVAAAFGSSGPQWDDASPLQLLQQAVKPQAAAAQQQQQQQLQSSANLLLNIPLQLITAQRDFHLKTDADKMHTVVKQYRDEHAVEPPIQRLHYDNENHFSLILKFGQQSDPATTAVMEFIKQIK
jgi:ABC-type nickel/cobalt efflux system permease component RcnA